MKNKYLVNYMKLEQIKNKIKKGDIYFFFFMTPNIPKLIVKGKKKTELKIKLKEKVIKNPNKYKNGEFVLFCLETRSGDDTFAPGDIIARTIKYKTNNKLKLQDYDGKSYYVWFSKYLLEKEGWKYSYLRNVAYLIKLKQIEFNIFAQPGYHMYWSKIDKMLDRLDITGKLK